MFQAYKMKQFVRLNGIIRHYDIKMHPNQKSIPGNA